LCFLYKQLYYSLALLYAEPLLTFVQSTMYTMLLLWVFFPWQTSIFVIASYINQKDTLLCYVEVMWAFCLVQFPSWTINEALSLVPQRISYGNLANEAWFYI